jgi:glyoxylase-like metal-dependent hydrolase (beta-lactamase superfamily II)
VAEASTPLPGITLIDTHMGGRPGVTSAYLINADQPALIESGPSTCLPAVAAALEQHGVGRDDLAHVVVTHIHIDHAGGAGSYARRFPRATVWAHERGLPHLVDPTKLEASATRVFGEDHMRRVFGPTEPLPQDRGRPTRDGDRISLGNRTLRIVHAPGHAKHHQFVVDEETSGLFSGDGLGVYLPDSTVLRPATPPPDFDVQAAVASIEVAKRLEPPAVLFSHFGPRADVRAVCDLAIERTRRWASIVEEALRRTDDLDEVARILMERTIDEVAASGNAPSSIDDRYDMLTTYRSNAAGLVRYFLKLRETGRAMGPA